MLKTTSLENIQEVNMQKCLELCFSPISIDSPCSSSVFSTDSSKGKKKAFSRLFFDPSLVFFKLRQLVKRQKRFKHKTQLWKNKTVFPQGRPTEVNNQCIKVFLKKERKCTELCEWKSQRSISLNGWGDYMHFSASGNKQVTLKGKFVQNWKALVDILTQNCEFHQLTTRRLSQ